MAIVINPTVGRKVWYFQSAAHLKEFRDGVHESQPFDATIVFVHGDSSVNLAINDHHGTPKWATGVTLVQPIDDAVGNLGNGPHARWMDYQVWQEVESAKKRAYLPPAEQERLGSDPNPDLGTLIVTVPADPINPVHDAEQPPSSLSEKSDTPSPAIGTKL